MGKKQKEEEEEEADAMKKVGGMKAMKKVGAAFCVACVLVVQGCGASCSDYREGKTKQASECGTQDINAGSDFLKCVCPLFFEAIEACQDSEDPDEKVWAEGVKNATIDYKCPAQ